jgi:ribosomal protein RSM22 (predicted rRNA methylase)
VQVTAKLCTAEGLVMAKVPKREKADYGAARRWRWGDAVMRES